MATGRRRRHYAPTHGIVSAPAGCVQGPSYEIARCAVCGHADARVIAERDVLRAELEALWAFHERRLRV